GLSFRKLGLGGEASRPDWPTRWASLRAVLPPGPSWVAVIYADWLQAQAPEPSRILDEAIRAGCSGLLIDTFDKTGGNPLDVTPFWRSLSTRTRSSGLFLALAGRLDRDAMARLAPLEPTLFAVRGAACRDGDRLGPIDPERVARLVEHAHSLA
ncbi:MAG TPA: (5-formylfuran-3-yl)methyl phosphate synthase, partial [Isosphaeraceae bacterium]|nr:(5-formylfuran-3-yl)methyl phosphate synthase [Isosphaeraceae bacterium]